MEIRCGLCKTDQEHYARGLCLRCYKKNYAMGKHEQYSFNEAQIKQSAQHSTQVCDDSVNKCLICRDRVIRARGMCAPCYKRMLRAGKLDSYEVNFFRTTEELELWAALQGMEQKMCAGWAIQGQGI